MRTGLSAKFLENDTLASFLTSTCDVRLADDKYWGVVLSMHDEAVWVSSKWKGKMSLRKILEEVQSAL